MYADRRKAFEHRIGEIFNDYRRAYPGSHQITNNQWRDLGSRIQSALEDSFQMGRRAMMSPDQVSALTAKEIVADTPLGDENRG